MHHYCSAPCTACTAHTPAPLHSTVATLHSTSQHSTCASGEHIPPVLCVQIEQGAPRQHAAVQLKGTCRRAAGRQAGTASGCGAGRCMWRRLAAAWGLSDQLQTPHAHPSIQPTLHPPVSPVSSSAEARRRRKQIRVGAWEAMPRHIKTVFQREHSWLTLSTTSYHLTDCEKAFQRRQCFRVRQVQQGQRSAHADTCRGSH
jgi:hypothetical protein